jgi:hypothetical protein
MMLGSRGGPVWRFNGVIYAIGPDTITNGLIDIIKIPFYRFEEIG